MATGSGTKKCCMFFTMCSSRSEARNISRALLGKKLAACTNILGPVESRFWWKGKIDKAAEFLIVGKTTSSQFAAVEKTIRAIHSYSVPEIIAVPISAGNNAYLGWIRESVK